MVSASCVFAACGVLEIERRGHGSSKVKTNGGGAVALRHCGHTRTACVARP